MLRALRFFVCRLAMVALLLACYNGPSRALTPISDAELAAVQGRDGFAFNLRDFALQGPLTLRLGASDGSGVSLANFALARSDDPQATFSDPYALSLVRGASGLPDRVQISEPLNALGLLRWQFAADLSLGDSQGSNFQAGALVLKDLRSYGGSLSLAPSADPNAQGIALGLSLRLDLGGLLLRPRGRGDTTLLNDPGSAEQFSLSGLHLAAATPAQQLGSSPWVLADLERQPLLLNAITTPEGASFLHLNLAWPTNGQTAPAGAVLIDNISFKSDLGANLDLGSSRIGALQVQYLDLRLKTGH